MGGIDFPNIVDASLQRISRAFQKALLADEPFRASQGELSFEIDEEGHYSRLKVALGNFIQNQLDTEKYNVVASK